MKPLAIYYAPGARGDYLSTIMMSAPLSSASFKTQSHGYKKIHHTYNICHDDLCRYFSIRIIPESPKDFFDITLLTTEKNKKNPKSDFGFYDALGVVSKNTIIEYATSDLLDFSADIGFAQVSLIEDIATLYSSYTLKDMPESYIPYMLENNKLNAQFLDTQYNDVLIMKSFELFKFEFENDLIFTTRKYDYTEFLTSIDYQKYFQKDNYVNSYREM